jgi:hypothetical protein
MSDQDLTRDNMTRCKVCEQLFADHECVPDPIKGLQCPNGCVEPFILPPYELPTNTD